MMGMLSGTTLRSAWGRAHIDCTHAQLLSIEGDTHAAVYHAQGYACADQRLWQLDLSRRLAQGRLSELLGAEALAVDRFQRKLNLRKLAQRSLALHAQDAERPFLQAYVDGLNQRLHSLRLLPVECLALDYRPEPFTLLDVYLIAHLKYFINSAWQFELYHTLVSSALDAGQAADLFCTIDEVGHRVPAMPGDLRVPFGEALQDLLSAARAALERLGLDSPDIGSNAFVVRGEHTRSGLPLLANDPHMGLVNPGFNMFFRLRSEQGLDVFGSNFPGGPGVVIGRNPDIAWGMIGVMMDNQDLYGGEVDLARHQVRTAQGWQTLAHETAHIAVRGGPAHDMAVHGFAEGHMLHAANGVGLFLRWPALDGDLGSVSLHTLNRAHDWPTFRQGLSEMRHAPGVAVYADRHNHIGAQMFGLLPRREAGREMAGALVLPLHEARWQWQGYVDIEQLPHEFNPESGLIVQANQYVERFLGDTYVSNRWHSPARALRIHELLAAKQALTAPDMAQIQDDQLDVFARTWLPRLLACLPASTAVASCLQGWGGDTRQVDAALLFERWIDALALCAFKGHLPPRLARDYLNYWPAWRWNLMRILFGEGAWFSSAQAAEMVVQSYSQAMAALAPPARVSFRHTLRRHPLLRRLFEASYPYAGGSRETIAALRRNVDFLTSGQGGQGEPAGWAYSFGTSFKMVFDLQPGAENLFLANMPNRGNPFGWFLRRHLRRWREGRRYGVRV